jgi:hypothetical protein
MARRIRLSLRTLFIVMLILCAGIGYYLTVRRLIEAERELRIRRAESGYLTIDDRTKVHAISMETDQPNTWRWRVFIPKGHRYEWRIACQDIPRDVPPAKEQTSGITYAPYWESDNELIVTATLRPSADSTRQLTVNSRIGESKNQMAGASLRIPEEKLDWMTTASDYGVLGENGTAVRDPKGPIILLMRRKHSTSPGPMPGFMIWLEEVGIYQH